jgi:hypothetical protein
MCLQPAFIPLFFSSLLTVAPSFSIYQLSAAEKVLGGNFSAHQVRFHNAYFVLIFTAQKQLTHCSLRSTLARA